MLTRRGFLGTLLAAVGVAAPALTGERSIFAAGPAGSTIWRNGVKVAPAFDWQAHEAARVAGVQRFDVLYGVHTIKPGIAFRLEDELTPALVEGLERVRGLHDTGPITLTGEWVD